MQFVPSIVLFLCLGMLAVGQAHGRRTVSASALSIRCLGAELLPISINNRSEILVRNQKPRELAILRQGAYSAMDIKAPGSCDMNDDGNILARRDRRGPSFIWVRGHRYDLRLPPNYFLASCCLNNENEVLVVNKQGDVGFNKNGRVMLLFHAKPSYRIHAHYMNDKHQVVGIIQGPFTASFSEKAKSTFTSRAFAWDGGKFRYLISPKTGFCDPTGINNNGQIVGEYRLEQGNPQIDAVVWRSFNGRMIDMNALMPDAKSWHLSVNVGINDKRQIIGVGEKNGKTCPYVCTLPPKIHNK